MEPRTEPVEWKARPLIAVARALVLAPFYFALLTLFAIWPWRFGSPFFLIGPLRLPEEARRVSVLRLFALRLFLRDKRLIQARGRRTLRTSRLKWWLLSPLTRALPDCASLTRREMKRTGRSGVMTAVSIFCDGLVDSYRYANGTAHVDWFELDRRPDGAFHVPIEYHIRSCCYLLNHKLNPQMPISRRHYDKADFEQTCRQHGLPTVPVYALFEGGRVKRQDHVPHVSLFSKPADMAEGKGEFTRWIPVTDSSNEDSLYSANDGQVKTLDGIFEHLKALSKAGPYLLQRRLLDHEGIRALSGAETLCTLRVPTCCFPDREVRVLPFALFKMPVVRDAVVNTGAKGAVIYPVELETGRLSAGAVRGKFETIAVQPTSGKMAAGFELPCWNETLDLCRTAHAEVFPTFPTVGWDVAITSDGPVLVEMNIQWLRPTGMPGEAFTGKTAYVDCILSYMRRFWPEQLPSLRGSGTETG